MLRAISDPTRVALFTVLKVSGPLPRRELARRVPDARGSMAAHLTHMTEAGWIELVEGDLRAGVWRTAELAMVWPSPSEASPELRMQIYHLDRLMSYIRFERVGQFIAECARGEWMGAWEDVVISRDYAFFATPAQLSQLEEELVEVIERHRRAAAENADDLDDTARNVAVYLYGFPGE